MHDDPVFIVAQLHPATARKTLLHKLFYRCRQADLQAQASRAASG
jgi:hypothetical protein